MIAKFNSPPAVTHGKMSTYFSEDSFLSPGPGIPLLDTKNEGFIFSHIYQWNGQRFSQGGKNKLSKIPDAFLLYSAFEKK